MTRDSDSPVQYHHGNLRRALLDAALELTEREGVQGLSIRAIARRAGVSHAAPYHHFADRTELVAAVAEEGFALLREAMLARMATTTDPRLRFRETGVGYVLFAVKHPAHFRVMFSAEVADKSRHPALEAAAEASRAVLVDAIVRCQDAGVLRDEDPQSLGLVAWSLVHGLAMLLLEGHYGSEGRTPGGAEALANDATRLLWADLWIDASPPSP